MVQDSGGNQNSEGKPKDKSDESRRNLLKVGLGVSAALVIGGVGSIARSLINPGVPETVATSQTTTTTVESSSSQSGGQIIPPAATPNFPVILLMALGC